MPVIAVIGGQWGDEGKGKVVDLLAQKADVVVRFSGGDNAGHTVVNPQGEFKLHLIPSGIFSPTAVSIMGNGMVINPAVLLGEMDDLKARGVDTSRLFISDRAHLIMPYHKSLDLNQEASLRSSKRIGTTGRGIGPCYGDKINRKGIKIGDLLDEELFRDKLRDNVEEKNYLLTKRLNSEGVSFDEIYGRFRIFAEKLAPFLGNVSVELDQARKSGRHILFEGAQGTQLDIDHGTYPFVTSSNTVAGNACTGSGFGPVHIDAVIGILKAYTTRVGSGPFPTELFDDTGDQLQKKGGEFGATTGRKRRCGWLDCVVANEAIRLNSITGLAVTKLDVLSGQPSLRIATSYEADRREYKAMPSNIRTTEKITPVYEEIPGWKEEIGAARSTEDLPRQARDYIKRIEEITETPAIIISVGPARDETLLLQNPFAG